jgi:hypothetical protein
VYPVAREVVRWSAWMATRHRVCSMLSFETFPLNEIQVNGPIVKKWSKTIFMNGLKNATMPSMVKKK